MAAMAEPRTDEGDAGVGGGLGEGFVFRQEAVAGWMACAPVSRAACRMASARR